MNKELNVEHVGDQIKYALNCQIRKNYQETLFLVQQIVQENGFGFVSEIDLQATMKNKLNHEMKGYKILGACAPQLALQVVDAEPTAGVLLPCQFVVREVSDQLCEVYCINPLVSLAASKNEQISLVAVEAKTRLDRVFAKLQTI
jgi:uncharacterized protein (DUF302 family)